MDFIAFAKNVPGSIQFRGTLFFLNSSKVLKLAVSIKKESRVILFLDDFFGGIFREDFFWRNFLGGFFGRNC